MTNLDGKTLRDLHWEDEGDWLEAETRIGGYVIMPESNELWFETHLFIHPGYFEEKRVMLARGDVDGLKQVANDHHRDEIMWAFSMEVPSSG